ncbi:MAG TPA: glutamate mutase L [Candidatus Krumholzibacteriaceae bacterium]|nr:glutamate mutase L [Candidatus Krumholzibacteriaceae bacterium]
MAALKKPTEEMQFIIATDVGSTTTKARLFHKKDGEWRFLVAGEAPTTVEAPYEDVTLGVQNAVREVEELTGHKLLVPDGSGIILPYDGEKGVDLYVTTSSAGGGLQMMVSGLIKSMTAESANRAALGAGAIVMDVIARDDGRQPYQKIRRIRSLRPDMILMAGGTDGGASSHVMEIAELIKAAEPKPRLGVAYKLPIVYAGNKALRPQIQELLKTGFALQIVDNIRPVLEVENTEPARRAVHELFMEHVMSHAPGYNRLMKWTDVDIMPTPAGEGMAMQLIANTFNLNVLGVGLGGATTNVYSVMDGRFVRSVSANLGMSYSVTNVMKEAGIDNIMRWIPFKLDREEVASRLMNKMIRPTTIPQTLEDLIVEHSVAREALRLGLKHHRTIATRLKGIQIERTISDMFDQAVEETYVKMMNIDILAGTGGLLSHAPRRIQSMYILTDAWQPEGVTRMFQDSVFMMPHLGVLSTVYRDAAWNIFDKDCLVRLGTNIAAAGTGKLGERVMTVELEMPNGEEVKEELSLGDIKLVKLTELEEAKALITPAKDYDIGAGPGKELEATVSGGVAGVILDARGRPIYLPEEEDQRKELLLKWFKTMDLYDESKLEALI